MKGIKVIVKETKCYSFDITEENGFDNIDFDDLDEVHTLISNVKYDPTTYCNPKTKSDYEIVYDQDSEFDVKVEMIKQREWL